MMSKKRWPCKFCTEVFKTAPGAFVHARKAHRYDVQDWLTSGLRRLPNIEEIPFLKTENFRCPSCDSYAVFRLYKDEDKTVWDCADCGRQTDVDRWKVARVIKALEYINSKKKAPCTDCKKKFPSICMDFDHLPEFEKKFAISQSGKVGYDIEAIDAELAKCELVCANCHRIRTAERSQSKAWEDVQVWNKLATDLRESDLSILGNKSCDEDEVEPYEELDFSAADAS